ncbi:MAG: branched-chain amino acid ABC transporter permease [Chloroflexota bacterium]|nr:branched-chain amino acid ABC transporter permease [Chloroflexota bacterium]
MAALVKQNRKFVTPLLWIGALVIIIVLLSPVLAEQRPARLVQSGITGLLVGGVYALIALGIVIINKASGVFNFAHGWMMLFGGFLFYSFFSVTTISPVAAGALALVTVLMAITMVSTRALRDPKTLGIGAVATVVIAVLLLVSPPLLRGIMGAVCGGVLIGLAVERFAIRPLIGQPLFAMVLMTLAAAELLQGVTQMIWGSVELPVPVFNGIRDLGIPVPIRFEGTGAFEGTIVVRTELLVAFILALLAFAAFVAFFRFTSVGLAMRATAENQKLAQAVGLRVRVILGVAWAIAALLAAVAGVLQGGATSLSLNMPLLALRAFPAVLLGGLDSIPGALVGGLVIGLVQEYANLLFPGTQAGTELAPYVVLMIVLVIRPDGLFGQKRIERI